MITESKQSYIRNVEFYKPGDEFTEDIISDFESRKYLAGWFLISLFLLIMAMVV